MDRLQEGLWHYLTTMDNTKVNQKFCNIWYLVVFGA